MASNVNSSLLFEREKNPPSVVGGVVVTLLAHIAVPATMMLAGVWVDEPDEEMATREFEELNIVAAEFVQLGEPLDPRQLPNRQVPILSTAPNDDTVVSKRPRRRRPRPDAGPPPPNATDDLLRRLGDRAQVFAELQERRTREGEADGLEDGTSKRRTGNEYLGRLMRIFRRGWTLPATISDAEREELRAVATVDVSETMQILRARIVNSSGNQIFDQSILSRIEAIRAQGDPLPEPPLEVEDRYRGAAIRLRFSGRQAR